MARRFLDRLYGACGLLACFSLMAIALIILAQIVGRLSGVLIPSADEFAGYAMGASTFLGLAHTLRVNGHIRVTMLLARLAPAAARRAEIGLLALGVATLAYFTGYTIDMAWTSYDFGDVSAGLVAVPLWAPQLGMALGLLLMGVALADDLWQVLRGRRASYADAPPVSE